MKVCVPHAPKGTEVLNLVAHFDLPRRRVMFVLTLVSSIETTRCVACAMADNVQRNQWWRAFFTWGLRRSSATRFFFCM